MVDREPTRTEDERMAQASPDERGDVGLGAASDPQVENLQRELSTLNDRHLRLAAEFDNYRKRTERERADLYARAQGELVRRLLDGLDDLERVADYAETSSATLLLEGVHLVEKKILHSLATAGLEMVDPAGQPFDPASMEAVGVVVADERDADGLVADVFQKGYRFAGSLIRPARVRVYQYGD